MNKSFQPQQMGCVQLTQSNLGTALPCPSFGFEMRWELKPRDLSCPQVELGSVLRAEGSCCVPGHCLVLVHSVRQHSALMACSDGAPAGCWGFAKQMFLWGWGGGWAGERNECKSNICFCGVFCACSRGFPAPRGQSCCIDGP